MERAVPFSFLLFSVSSSEESLPGPGDGARDICAEITLVDGLCPNEGDKALDVVVVVVVVEDEEVERERELKASVATSGICGDDSLRSSLGSMVLGCEGGGEVGARSEDLAGEESGAGAVVFKAGIWEEGLPR